MRKFDYNRKSTVRRLKEIVLSFFLFSLFTFNVQAQKQVVTGIIKTSNYDALQGISIAVKGNK